MSHTLSLTQEAPYASGYFVCNLCWEKGSGPSYHCAHCEFDLHTTCAAIEKQQTHFTHFKHPLHLIKSSSNGHICDGCGSDIHRCKWFFRCDLCDHDMHSLCVRAPRFVLHPSHHHALTLFKTTGLSGSCRCDACGDHAVARVYRCSSCNYDLHQSCATLPLKVIHPKHAEHNLTLLFGSRLFTCDECKEEGKGWLFHCPLCRYNLHTKCANISHELPHVDVQAFSHERNFRAASSKSVMRNTTPAARVTDADLEAAERILSFVRLSMTESSSHLKNSTSPNLGSSSKSLLNDDQDICPTCLEGYDLRNPKKITNCGHNFHLACLLEWMERSSHCPVCRQVMVMDDEY